MNRRTVLHARATTRVLSCLMCRYLLAYPQFEYMTRHVSRYNAHEYYTCHFRNYAKTVLSAGKFELTTIYWYRYGAILPVLAAVAISLQGRITSTVLWNSRVGVSDPRFFTPSTASRPARHNPAPASVESTAAATAGKGHPRQTGAVRYAGSSPQRHQGCAEPVTHVSGSGEGHRDGAHRRWESAGRRR